MKVLKRILNWTIWSLVGLHIAVFLLLQTRPVQSWLGGKVSQTLSEVLGTKTTVGRVEVGLSGRLIIDNVCIPDLQGDTLLRVSRLSVKAALLPLLDGHFDIASAQLFGAHLRLYQADDSTAANWQFVIDALAASDTTQSKPLDLHIGSLIVRRSSVSYDRGDAFTTPGQLNPAHIAVKDISTHIALKTLTPDTLNVNLRRLSLREQSGLVVENFTGRLTAGPRATQLRDCHLQLPASAITIDTLDATYALGLPTPPHATETTGQRFMESLHYRANIDGTVTPADLSPIAAHLQSLPPITVATSLSGTAKSLNVSRLNILSTNNDLALIASGGINGERTLSPDWHLQLDQCDISADIIATLKGIFPVIPDELLRLGNVRLNGHALRQADGLTDGQATIATSLGGARLSFAQDSRERLSGSIDTDSLHLGRLLANNELGTIAANVTLGGTLKQPEASANIHSLHFKGHNYRNITASGSCQPKTGALNATLTIDDPDLKADIDGALTPQTKQQKALHVKSSIAHLRPSALGLTDKWGDAAFSATVDADLAGSTLGDVCGRLRIDDFTMRSASDSLLCFIDHLLLTAEKDGDGRLLTIDSDIADGEVTSEELVVRNLSLSLKDTRWMHPLLGISLTLRETLQLTASTDKTEDGDDITASLTWGGEHDSQKNIINAVAQLRKDTDGQTITHVNVKPSQVIIGGSPWYIHPSRLTYHEEHLAVDSFAVSHGAMHLIVDGKASASDADTLSVDLNGIDVAYVQDLLDFHPVDFSGQLSGKAFATSLFSSLTSLSAWADIVTNDFHFQDGRMGTLHAKARWNGPDTQIDIDAIADDGPYSKTFITGYISPVRSDIDLKIRAEGSNIEFCHSFTGSLFRDINGAAHGLVELAGPLGGMNLTGQLTVEGLMTVDALNTTYRMISDTVYFVPNDIQLRGATIYDRDDNTATLSGGIHHQELSDFTFDIDVVTNNALVYDFPTFGDSNICGTVRANGRADLHGRPGEVVINCDVTPQAGSTFSYNAANPDAVSKQEFITWGTSGGEEHEASGESPHPSHEEYDRNLLALTSYPSSQESDLLINFLINATPDATLRVLMDANTGDYITLNGEGTIRASFHNKGPFHMFGTYNVSRGTYGITIQNIIKKNFTFQPEGTIVFGGDPYDAALNLQAVHTVNGVSLSDLNLGSSFASNTVRVNCLMNITGTPAQPQVEFDLEMPTVNSEENQMIRSLIASEQEMNQQVLYLLGIGRFYTQGANNADAQQYGQTTLAMQSFLSGTVSTQINEVLSQVIKSNDWNFGANISTGDEGWNNAEYEGMVSGRLLDNRLLINGQFGYRDRTTTTTPSFIGDFDLQYLLKRNGNFAVKVYNQTNDRYFTRSSLNTQGVGLVMKKDFDGLRDLFRKKKTKVKDEKVK